MGPDVVSMVISHLPTVNDFLVTHLLWQLQIVFVKSMSNLINTILSVGERPLSTYIGRVFSSI